MAPHLRAYLALTLAALRTVLRNPVGAFALVATLLLLMGFIKVISTSSGPHVRVALVEPQRSPAADQLAAAIAGVPGFDVVRTDSRGASQLLTAGNADLGVTLPAGVGARDASGRPIPTSLAVRYRAGSAGENAIPALRGAVEAFDERVLGQAPPVGVEAAPVNGRRSSPIDGLLPGVIAFNIIGGALMMAAGTFSNYKTTGVLRRLKATGIGATTFVLAHATSAFVAGALQTLAIVLVAKVLFEVQLDLLALVLIVFLGYLVFLALGLAISGWIKDPQRATATAQSIAFPLIFVALLYSALPPAVASVTRVLPISYVTDALQQIAQGGTLAAVTTDVAWLCGWAIVLMVGAARVFRWD